MHAKAKRKALLKRGIMLFIGSMITGVGLEIFLIPNDIVDGGIVGLSIIARHFTHLPLGIFIIVFNLPFLFLGYKLIGKTFVVSSLFAIVSLSLWTQVFAMVPAFTKDILLSSVFGGIIMGVGLGLIIRNGGSTDGTEMVAIIINKHASFSVGETVMFFNIFILGSAGFVFGWDKAMYSLITYFIAFKVIDITIEGLNEAKAAMIVSNNGDEIAEAIIARLGRGVTFINGYGGYSKKECSIIYAVVTRLEVAKLKSIVYDKDATAFVTITDVADVMGGRHKKRSIH